MSGVLLLLCLFGDVTAAQAETIGAPPTENPADAPAPVGDPPPPLGDIAPDTPPLPTTTEKTPPSSFVTPRKARGPQHFFPPYMLPPLGGAIGAIGGAVGGGVGAAYAVSDLLVGGITPFDQPDFITFAVLLSTPAFAALVAGFFVVALVVPEPDIDHFGNVAACSAAGCVGTWLLLGLGLGGGAGCGTATCPSGSDCHGCGNVSASNVGSVDDSVGIAAAAAAGIGAMLGMGTGFLIGKVLDDEVGNTSAANQRVGTAIGLVVGGGVGGGVGGVFVGVESSRALHRAQPRGSEHDEGLGELQLTP